MLTACLLGQSAQAVDRHWTGSVSTTWGLNANWDTSAPSAGDNGVFNSAFTNQPSLAGNTSVGGLWLTGSIGQNVTISATIGTLTLQTNTINGTTGLGILVDNANAYTLTISAPLQIGDVQAWTNSSANLFTVSGSVNINNKALTINGTGNTTISGVVSGAGGFTKAGSSTLTLSNTGDTYTGQLTVQAGTLSIGAINNDSANGELGNNALSVILGNTGSSTGTLEYTGGTASSTKKFTMATGGTGAFQIDTAGTTLTLSGVIDGSGALNKTGAGTLTLSGANIYTGKTSIQNGTLSVSSLNKVTGGSASSSLGAPTTVANGTIDIGSTTNSGTLIYTGSGETTDRVINLAGTTGGTIIENDGSGALTFSSDVTATGAGSKTLTLQGSNSGSNTISGTIVDNSSSNTTSVTKAGAGTWVLSGANTYRGTTTINAGTLSLDSAGSTAARLANTSGITINSDGTLLLANSSGTTSTDRINNSATVTVNGGGTFKTGGLSEGTRPTNGSATDGAAGMGALTLQNTTASSHATIDFGSTTAGSSLVFSSLSAASKGAFVDILNWGGTAWTDNGATTNDRLLFATDPGFTATDLAHFAFSGFATGAVEIVYGNLFEICPVPEPSTWFAGFLALAALGYQQRRRLSAVFHRHRK